MKENAKSKEIKTIRPKASLVTDTTLLATYTIHVSLYWPFTLQCSTFWHGVLKSLLISS